MNPDSSSQAFAQQVRDHNVGIAIVLGSGMSALADRAQLVDQLSFEECFEGAGLTVAGHRGQLSLRVWDGVPVLLCEGRFHYYEGNTWDLVTRPVRFMQELGIRSLLQTNAAGGIDPQLTPGSFMLLLDHVEVNRPYCWRHPGPLTISPQRTSPYSELLGEALMRSAEAINVSVGCGIYACMTGPSYETPSEIRALRALGASAVGMSTARESQVGHDLGMQCAALSCITNCAAGITDQPLSHEEVLVTAREQATTLADLLGEFVKRVGM